MGTLVKYDHQKKVWKVKFDANDRVGSVPARLMKKGGAKDLRKMEEKRRRKAEKEKKMREDQNVAAARKMKALESKDER